MSPNILSRLASTITGLLFGTSILAFSSSVQALELGCRDREQVKQEMLREGLAPLVAYYLEIGEKKWSYTTDELTAEEILERVKWSKQPDNIAKWKQGLAKEGLSPQKIDSTIAETLEFQNLKLREVLGDLKSNGNLFYRQVIIGRPQLKSGPQIGYIADIYHHSSKTCVIGKTINSKIFSGLGFPTTLTTQGRYPEFDSQFGGALNSIRETLRSVADKSGMMPLYISLVDRRDAPPSKGCLICFQAVLYSPKDNGATLVSFGTQEGTRLEKYQLRIATKDWAAVDFNPTVTEVGKELVEK